MSIEFSKNPKNLMHCVGTTTDSLGYVMNPNESINLILLDILTKHKS